jgi:hypothetical protein
MVLNVKKRVKNPNSRYSYQHEVSWRVDDYNFPLLFAISSSKIIPTGPPRLPSPAHCSSGTRSAGHSHRPLKSSGVLPSIHSTILSPITGKNLKPCPEPPVARNSPLYLGWYEIKKSPSLVSVYQQIFDLVNGREGAAREGCMAARKSRHWRWPSTGTACDGSSTCVYGREMVIVSLGSSDSGCGIVVGLR